MKRILASITASLALLALLVVNPAAATERKPLVAVGAQTKVLPSGDTLKTNASASGGASINVPHGSAPSSPNNGDIWTTTSGVFGRVNGATAQLNGYVPGGTDVAVADGGTGVSTTPSNGQLLIGNGSGYTVANLTGGANVTITNSAGGITIASSISGGTVGDGDYGDITVSSSGTIYTIDPATVTAAKMAASVLAPGGRLTLVSGTPVLASDQTAKSQVYYTCYRHKFVSYYDGTNDLLDAVPSCEVSLTMATSGTGVTNSAGVFDIFWSPANDNICVVTNGSGGGWASDTGGSNTARGTGYSQVHNTRGYWTNQNSLTHCYNGTTDYGSISADRATYLGTVYTTAAGQTGMAFKPAGANGGTNNVLGVYNGYNRVPIFAQSNDTTGSWGVTSSTWAKLNVGGTGSGANNRISWVDGLQTSTVRSLITDLIFTTANAAVAGAGVVLDATSGTPATYGRAATNAVANLVAPLVTKEGFQPQLGFHFLQAMQGNTGNVGTATLIGGPDFQFIVELEM